MDQHAPALRVERGESRTVVSASGDLDLTTSPELRECIARLVEDGVTSIVVDLTDVQYVDSATLGVLIGARKRIDGVNGTLVLVCPHDRILRVFRMTRLDHVFTILPSLPDAVGT